VQIGVRLLLPCVAFGVVGLAGALAETAAHAHTLWLRRATAGIAAGAAAWLAAISGSAWPDGLRYVNELWGGPEKGYEIVSDSNYDWGQGVPGLADFARRRGLGDLEVWYFGTDPDVDRPPLRQVKLHLLPVACGDDVRAQVRGRYLAAGTSVVYGCGLTDAHRAAQAYLRTLTPVARTSTFLVYDLRPEGTP
jgi:hypothetical protein